MKLKTRDLVVKPRYSPRLKLVLAGAAAVGLVMLVGGIYNLGLARAGFERDSAVRQQHELQGQIQQLQDENRELRESLAKAQLALQMDQTAYQELDRSLKTSSEEIVKLREELNFYRSIISPANKSSGVQIQRLEIQRAATDNEFQYQLVLIQALKHDRNVTGQVRLEVSGERGGEQAKLVFPEPAVKPIQVNFKYFQDIQGSLTLPRGFTPAGIKVSVTPRAGEIIEKTYDWPAL